MSDGADGQRVVGGRYCFARLLKASPGAATYLAADDVTGAPVIVKTVTAGLASPAARLRLEHEARVLRQLDGPSGPAILDSGRDADVLYLVQPFCPGETLAQRLGRGPLSTLEA